MKAFDGITDVGIARRLNTCGVRRRYPCAALTIVYDFSDEITGFGVL